MEIRGFRGSQVKKNLVTVFSILTVGVLRLFLHWYPHLHVKATHRKCSLRIAETVLVIDTYKKFKSYFVKKIETLKSPENSNGSTKRAMVFNLCDGRQKRLHEARILRCKKLIYIWDEESGRFFKLAGFDKGISRSQLHVLRGQSIQDQIAKRMIYGNNEITVPVQTILTLLALEVLTPFYMFQICSLTIWMIEEYYYYSIALIILTCSGITTSILQTRRNQMNLRGTVHSMDTAMVLRDEAADLEEIPTADLVPGDVIAIPPTGCSMQCDAVLISGCCVVNESMLTGESVPITKTALPDNQLPFHLKEDVNHTLFCGTKVIQTRIKGDERVLAVVIRTGYLTAKGELVRSILYPPPADFKFETDSYKFIGILAVIACIGVIYTIVSKSLRFIKATDILIKSLDIFTIAVPPALPAAMTVGKIYALNRLKKSNIYCINSRVINVSGSVDCICFDKTGTLTEDELDMWGVVPVENHLIGEPVKDPKALSHNSAFLQGMASCHSLSVIKGELGGDPLDVKMFEATGWVLLDPDSNRENHHVVVKPMSVKETLQISIVKQFQFSSNLQRMSVIINPSTSCEHFVFCKGSPEMVSSLCDPSSVPFNFHQALDGFASQGYRVIALANKRLPQMNWKEVDRLRREDLESELKFLGFIVLENKLKPQTKDAIRTLKNANMKVVMITGDNIQTAVHIARECVMVDPDQSIVEVVATEASGREPATVNFQIKDSTLVQEMNCNGNTNQMDIEKGSPKKVCFAVSGKSWANILVHFPELIPKIVTRGTIFARMSGLQKQQLIEELKDLGYYVAMCGDGANDCGALKAAHVGISLSEAESSVASPFTYKEQNISCIPLVVKEGRAALITSFGVFKQMLCYSLLQFASVILLYNIDANLNSFQFLFIDLCLMLTFVSVFGNTEAYETLAETPPRTSLMGIIPIASVTLFLIIAAGFQSFAFYYISSYDWFVPFDYNASDKTNFWSYQNYAVFTTSIFQYAILVTVFSKGKPYRQPLYTNKLLTLALLVNVAVCAYITLIPAEWIQNLFVLKMPPMEARYLVITLSAICFVACFVTEDFIVDYLLDRVIVPRFNLVTKSRKYLRIVKVLEEDPSWPYVEQGEINKAFVGSQDTISSTT